MTDFATLAQVKHFTGNDASTTQDATLAAMISAVSETIRHAIGRDLLTASYTLTFDGKGESKFQFPQFPATAVASVTIDGETIPARTDVTSTTAAYAFNENVLSLIGTCFTPGVQNCVVQYTAGYDTVPASIRHACIRWVAFLLAKNDRIDLSSKAMGQETTAYLSASMPPDVRHALSQWRRVSL